MRRWQLLVFVSLLFWAGNAHANAGLPMIALVWPGMWISLIFVVSVEAFYISKNLVRNFKEVFWPSLWANVLSTLLGYPLAWGLLLGIEMVFTKGQAWGVGTFKQDIIASVLQAAWLIPYEEDLHWILPIAVVVNLIPAFFISWFSEAWMFSKIIKQPFNKMSPVLRNANLISYGMLLLVLGIYFGINLKAGK